MCCVCLSCRCCSQPNMAYCKCSCGIPLPAMPTPTLQMPAMLSWACVVIIPCVMLLHAGFDGQIPEEERRVLRHGFISHLREQVNKENICSHTPQVPRVELYGRNLYCEYIGHGVWSFQCAYDSRLVNTMAGMYMQAMMHEKPCPNRW